MKGRRRPKDESDLHWLGDGISGQASLFAELDPYLYRADSELCAFAKAMRFEHQSDRDELRMILVPPDDAVGWQLGELSEYGLLWVRHREPDELQEEVCEQFGVASLEQVAEQELVGNIDLVLLTDPAYDSIATFRESVRSAQAVLSARGRAICLVRGRVEGTDTALLFGENEELPLGDVLDGKVFLFPRAEEAKVLPFFDVSAGEDEYLRKFLKRHRRYFGKAALGACLERMRDPDFVELLAGPGSQLRASVLLVFGGDGMLAEKGA